MTRNKWQTQRFGTMARNGLALALSLSMVLGMMPTGALQALAEEADVLETTPLEASLPDDAGIEEAAGSGATELQDESAENEGSEDAGAAEEETTAEELEPGVTEEPGAAEEPSTDEAVAEGEGVAEAVDEAVPAAEVEAEDTQLEAEADGVRATLVVAAGVELPEGARLVVTPLDAAVEQAAAAAEEAEKAAAAEAEGGTEGVFASALSGLGDALAGKDSQVVTGADVALAGMTNAVDECVAKQEQESEAPATDEEQQTVVSAAYAIEVVDGEDHVVSVSDDQAELTVTFDDGAAVKESEGVYAVKRDEAQPDDKPQVTEAMGAPVATVAEEEYKSEKAAAKAVVFSGEATDVTDDVKVDEESGAATIVLAGAPSVVVTKNAPMKAVRPANSPGPVDTNRVMLRDSGYTVNLFNYYAVDSGNWNANQIHYSNGQVNTNDVDPKGINSVDGTRNTLRDFLFFKGGTNENGSSGYNFYTGGTATPMQGIVKEELQKVGDEYYPVLAYPKNSDGTSLKYLFDGTPITQTVGGQQIKAKECYMDVDGLFTRDAHGYIVYDSNENYAYYDTSNANTNRTFTVYQDTFERRSTDSSNIDNYKIGFFPFDKWDSNANNNIDPGKKDHHLGMSMSATFTMPEDPGKQVTYTRPDGTTEKNDMLFEMGGDDDMLVFIDGVLVLDLGGIHQPVHGSIDFTHGKINIIGDPIIKRYHESGQAGVTRATDTDGRQLTYQTVSGEIIEDGKSYGTHEYLQADLASAFAGTNVKWNDAPGSSHRIDIFYLERGSYDSNLLIRMNLPLTVTTDLNVKKVWKGVNGNVETDHSDAIYVQLYQQKLLSEENGVKTYSDPRPYGDPVKLEPNTDSSKAWAHLFEGLPVHSDLQDDYYYYTVKEGHVVNGVFVPSNDGQIVSDGKVYGFDSTVYEYADSSRDAETYPDQQDAAFHNGNSAPSIGTATITNKCEGSITVEKVWLSEHGAHEEGDELDKFADTSVYVQLVKLEKAPGAADFSEATETPIAVKELNAGNNWRSGFDGIESVKNDNVMYIVREGTMTNGVFQPNNEFNASGKVYELAGIDYYRTLGGTSSGESTTVSVLDRTDADYRARHSYDLYWDTDTNSAQTTYWLNRFVGGNRTELDSGSSIPLWYEDDPARMLSIPREAEYIPDGAGSNYDYVVDVAVAGGDLTLSSVTVDGLAGSGYTVSQQADGSFRITVPAAWAKAHARETFTVSGHVSTAEGSPRTPLHEAATFDDPATIRFIPTDYLVTKTDGTSAPIQDVSWPTEGGIQLETGGTGHAIIMNKPVKMVDLTLKKTVAKDGTALAGAKFKVYRDAPEEEETDVIFNKANDIKSSQQYPNAETEFVTGDGENDTTLGEVTITGLRAGSYWIVETKAPEGYSISHTEDNPIGVTVAEDGTISLIATSVASDDAALRPTFTAASGKVPASLTVPNARLYELPAAGGPGAYPFLLAGSFIAALAFDRSGELRRKMLGLIRRSSKA